MMSDKYTFTNTNKNEKKIPMKTEDYAPGHI